MRGKTILVTLAPGETYDVNFSKGTTMHVDVWPGGFRLITPDNDILDMGQIAGWNTNFERFTVRNDSLVTNSFGLSLGDGQFTAG